MRVRVRVRVRVLVSATCEGSETSLLFRLALRVIGRGNGRGPHVLGVRPLGATSAALLAADDTSSSPTTSTAAGAGTATATAASKPALLRSASAGWFVPTLLFVLRVPELPR